jgi:hypothetical protein
MTRTAHCCCGALRVEASADPDVVGVCHCGECQRRTGSVFGVVAFFKKEHVFARKAPQKSMSVTGRRGESSECIFARHAERRCFGKPT